MSTDDKKPIYDHVKWNYPFAVNAAKNGDKRLQDLIEELTLAGLELQDIEEDLATLSKGAKSPTDNETPTIRYTRPVGFVIGHTAKAGGAYSKTLQSNEYDYWVNNILAIIDGLKNTFGIPAHFQTRNNGTSKAYAEIDKFNPLFTCELHFNGSVDPSAAGFETLALRSSTKGKRVAKLFNAAFDFNSPVRMRRQENDGVKELYHSDSSNTSRGLYNLSRSVHPSILTEPFFGSNETDSKNFTIHGFVRALGEAYIQFEKES